MALLTILGGVGYVIAAGLFSWLVRATNEYWDEGVEWMEGWLLLAWLWPLGIAVYCVRLVVLAPKALYERFNYGTNVWRDYFQPWYRLLW